MFKDLLFIQICCNWKIHFTDDYNYFLSFCRGKVEWAFIIAGCPSSPLVYIWYCGHTIFISN